MSLKFIFFNVGRVIPSKKKSKEVNKTLGWLILPPRVEMIFGRKIQWTREYEKGNWNNALFLTVPKRKLK